MDEPGVTEDPGESESISSTLAMSSSDSESRGVEMGGRENVAKGDGSGEVAREAAGTRMLLGCRASGATNDLTSVEGSRPSRRKMDLSQAGRVGLSGK